MMLCESVRLGNYYKARRKGGKKITYETRIVYTSDRGDKGRESLHNEKKRKTLTRKR